MTDMVWENPPPEAARGPKARSALFVAELEKHPGRWAKWGEFTHPASATRLKKKYAHIEWVTRTVDGKVHIYACFNGGKS